MRNWLSFDWKRNSRAPGRFGGRTAYRAAGLLLGSSILGTGVAADADPLPAPSFIAPLAANPKPFAFDGGPFGKVFVTGQVSGLGLVQSHTQASPGTGNAASLFDLDNAQVEIQTTSGPVQFYLQAGAYSLPALGTPYLRTGNAVDQEFGELPVAYMKFVPMPEISVQVGALPTLIGAESTFSFQNINIEHGLLWNQEPAISKGVQLNYTWVRGLWAHERGAVSTTH
jgi:Putative beta-barrel porin-2, OmpL-like. bbp2